jgi:hypothetical protein
MRVFARVCVCVCVCVYLSLNIVAMKVVAICVHASMSHCNVCICMHVSIYLCMLCVCVYIYVHTHTHMRPSARTHTHTVAIKVVDKMCARFDESLLESEINTMMQCEHPNCVTLFQVSFVPLFLHPPPPFSNTMKQLNIHIASPFSGSHFPLVRV